MDYLSISAGVGTGILLTAVGYWLVSKLSRKHASAIRPDVQAALEGVWVEHVPAAIGRSISVGHIYFDKKNKRLAFDGTNYHDNLLPYCYWTTMASSYEESAGIYQYMFRSVLEGNLDKIYHGHGTVMVSENAGSVSVERGFYVSISVDAMQMSHTMIKPALLQHKNAYKKVFTPEELATILRNAGIATPSSPAQPTTSQPEQVRQTGT